MKHIYESEVLHQLMERDGFNIPSSVPPYEAEIKAYLINQVKQAYPKLTDYEAEWLLYNYTKHLPAEFPISSVSDVTNATFDNVVPYAYKSAILKGQTLVNLASKKTTTLAPSSNDIISNDLIKSKTTYTISFNVDTLNESSKIRIRNVLLDGSYSSSILDVNIIIGKNIVTVTTLDNVKNLLLNYHSSFGTSEVVIDDIVIIEGNHADIDIPYFEGMQSVKMPVLTTVGKNLFNADIVKGNRNVSTGEVFVQKGYATTSDFIPISSNQKISFSLKNTNKYRFSQFLFYDGDKSFISNSTSSTVTTPTNAKFIHIGLAKLDTTNDFTEDELVELKDMIQVEYGDKTPYEPFKSNILTTPEEVELRGIGDVKDELNVATGELTQRIGEIVLNGSEDWKIRNDLSTEETTGFYIVITDKKKRGLMVADKLKTLQTGADSIGNNTIDDLRWGGGYFFIHKNISSVNDFKTWLSQDNITVQYELAESTVKTVDLTTVNENGEKVYFIPLEGTMHVSCTSETIQPTFDMSVPVEATTQNLASFINLEMEE